MATYLSWSVRKLPPTRSTLPSRASTLATMYTSSCVGKHRRSSAGVEMNVVEAAKWHLLAAAGGVKDESLDKVVARLSKADRARAQKAAEDWRDKQQMGIE